MACEVALALVLLVSGGLMMKSYTNLKRVDPGFESSGLLVATMNLQEKSYPSRQQKSEFVRRLEERFKALNGVISVGWQVQDRLDTAVRRFSTRSSVKEKGVKTRVNPFFLPAEEVVASASSSRPNISSLR